MREWWNRKSPEDKAAAVARRDKDRVHEADRERAVRPERRSHQAATTRAWRKADPRRARAHSAVARALRSGVLTKGACERLGDDCRGVTHAHHDDYDAPLDVRWLCAHHHHEERRKQ